MAARETLCTRCKHRKVCKYVNALMDLEVDISNMSIEEPHSANIKCHYYELNGGLQTR